MSRNGATKSTRPSGSRFDRPDAGYGKKVPDLEGLRATFRARGEDQVTNLAGYSTDATPFVDDPEAAEESLESGALGERVFDEHELLYANADRSVLLVLQGLDCSGKNGTIKHVVIKANPAGVRVSSFKERTEQEERQPLLQRYVEALPAPGQLGVFDRSHYEDVIVPQAVGEIDEAEAVRRIDAINEWERGLVDDGTIVVKCMLHISYDEQRERFLRRLRRDDKRWKFSEADIETRRHWNEFIAAYSTTIGATSPDHAPWYVIPADHKWYRNWAVATILCETLASLGLDYPRPDLDLGALRARLEPPN